MTPRAALYHRVSTVDQNPDAARTELRGAAERYGFAVALDIEETGSGANNQRPGLVQVLDAAQRGEAGLVIKHPAFYVDVVQLDYPPPKARVAFTPPWAKYQRAPGELHRPGS